MLNRLHMRIIVGLGALLMLFGIATQVIQQSSTLTCIHEVHQKMNRELAGKLVETWLESEGPILAKGRVSSLFKEILDANPHLSIYLLNAAGEIVCTSENVLPQTDKVVLLPISNFLDGTSPLPIYGTDPQDPSMSCLFSVAPILDNETTIGYLYVLLEGAEGKSISQLAAESNVMWVSSASTVIGLIFVMAVGAVLVMRSTSRIRALADQMESFRRSGFTRASVFDSKDSVSTREISHLQQVSHQMAEKISVQIKELQRANEFRRELVTNVGHDLRTPLASLQGYLESIQIKDKHLDPESREEYINVALKNARRLSSVVEEMNELSHLDNGDIELERVPITIQDIFNDSLLEVQSRLRKRKISFNISIPDSVSDITGDAHLVNRALSNIILHIVRHARDETSLYASIIDLDDAVELIISDPNRHMTEQELTNLFERPYQEADNSQANPGGTGLAISHRIISLHGGALRAESYKKSGTKITIILPRS